MGEFADGQLPGIRIDIGPPVQVDPHRGLEDLGVPPAIKMPRPLATVGLTPTDSVGPVRSLVDAHVIRPNFRSLIL
jgi:hypothetical protein